MRLLDTGISKNHEIPKKTQPTAAQVLIVFRACYWENLMQENRLILGGYPKFNQLLINKICQTLITSVALA